MAIANNTPVSLNVLIYRFYKYRKPNHERERNVHRFQINTRESYLETYLVKTETTEKYLPENVMNLNTYDFLVVHFSTTLIAVAGVG